MKTYNFTVSLRDDRKVTMFGIEETNREPMLEGLRNAMSGKGSFTLTNKHLTTGVETTTVLNGSHILDVFVEEAPPPEE